MAEESNKLIQKLRGSFPTFLKYMFWLMGLPSPTRMQLLVADMLQKKPSRRMVFLVYRGFGKTLIFNLFLLWELWNNPELEQAVWGQNQNFAAASVGTILNWVNKFDLFADIRPTNKQRQSTHAFDTPQHASHARCASVTALSIGGAIVGSRADTLLIDDPETSQNGYTQQRRENLDRNMQEATAVIKQTTGRIVVAGTPHFDRSLYTRLKQKGYQIWIIPMAVPPKHVVDQCLAHYPKIIRKLIEENPEGTPLDRFNEEEIKLKQSEGTIYYERQYLMNMYRSANSARPLDLTRAILYDANPRNLPAAFEHAREPQYVADEMSEYSCADIGERLYRPFKVSESVVGYDDLIAYVDPAGKGRDELVLTIGGAAGGYAVVFKVMGLMGGITRDNIERIIDACIDYNVSRICVESNLNTSFQWIRAVMDEKYAPMYGRAKLPQVVPKHQQANKEVRILETLDAVLNTGRLILTPGAIIEDYLTAQDRGTESFADYTLTAQISNFSPKEKLPVDDRIDTLAGLLSELANHLNVTPSKQAVDREYQRMEDYLRQPALRGLEDLPDTPDVLKSTPPKADNWKRSSTKWRK